MISVSDNTGRPSSPGRPRQPSLTNPDPNVATGSGRRSHRVEQGSDVMPDQDAARSIRGPEEEGSLRSPLPAASVASSVVAERVIPRRRVSRHQLTAASVELSARSLDILASLAEHPFLTTTHLLRFHFTGHTTDDAAGRICRRVLARLAEQRLIEHLQRRIGGIRAGSASYVWRLGPAGDRLLREGMPDSARARRKEPSLRHLEHSLAIADAHLAVLEAQRRGQFDQVILTTEPSCWRNYLGASGAREVLKPDLLAVTVNGDYEDLWFIEIDRGTESLPTLLRKCQQYETYRRSGIEQASGGVFPWVVWVLPDQARLQRLRTGLRTRRELDPLLFRLTTADQLVALMRDAPS